MNIKEKKIIFVTGASRSGTTLLSFVLRNHRQVFGLKELHFFGEAWDPRTTMQFNHTQAIEAIASMLAHQEGSALSWTVTDEHRRNAIALIKKYDVNETDPASVFAAAAHGLANAAGKSIPCEQTPRNIFYAEAILRLFPSASIVHILRDPRAVLASQKKRWQRRKLSAKSEAQSRYESLRVWVNYHPYTAARLWRKATDCAIRFRENPRVTLIRFEDLVQAPEATVSQLCDRLQLDYCPQMLEVEHVNSSHQSSVGGARKGLQADVVDKWKNTLDATEVAIAERYCAPQMQYCGYELYSSNRGFSAAEIAYGFRYIAHLGGVVLVNPRRAWIQARAMSSGRVR